MYVIGGERMTADKKKPINIEIGKNIRKYREQCGYSREQLAEKIEVSPRFIANVEVGAVGVSPSTIKRVCEVLGVSADSILWEGANDFSIDERLKHVPKEYLPYIHQLLTTQIEMIEQMAKQ